MNSPQGFGHTGVWEPLSFNKDRIRIERQVENPWEGVSGAWSSQALQGCECVWGVTIIQPFFHSTSLYEKTYPIPGMAPKNAGTVVREQEGHSSCVQEVRLGKCHQARATSYIPECSCGTPEAHRNPPGFTEEDQEGPDERKMLTLAILVHNSRGIIYGTHCVFISFRTPGGYLCGRGKSVWVSRKSRVP